MPCKAPVEWWDGSFMYVRCPECDKIHRHGFDGNYEIKHRRASHCDSSKSHPTYDIQFPGKYEIDKERALFIAAGSDPTEYFLEKDARTRAPLYKRSGVRRWEEATEKVYQGEGMMGERIDEAVAELGWGNVAYVRNYIESSSDSDIFLHGIDAYDNNGRIEDNDATDPDDARDEDFGGTGNTALHYAACESNPEMNRLLLQKGADPNLLNFEGRTPLAEAALWGRLENVKILLENGANKNLECFRSGRCLRAIDFAKPTDANEEERYSRSRGGYKEDFYQRKHDRRAIVRLLEDDTEILDTQNHFLSCFAFTKTPGQETRLTLHAHFDIPNVWKTIAVLDRGHRFKPIAAMSGWAHHTDDRENVLISGRDWTSEVLRLCKIAGYGLELDWRDIKDEPGSYHACHAEKQLVAYFINKHYFLKSELRAPPDPDDLLGKELGILSKLSLKDASNESSNTRADARGRALWELHRHVPPFGLETATIKTATIMVPKGICRDCKLFVDHINLRTGLNINVIEYVPILDQAS
ncbi:hypothetical protein ANO14919_098600 [Xylariales sp. No.14919]|nr:hypothetical protein ANO14919_098600 [Xylariales sp. No.14919]